MVIDHINGLKSDNRIVNLRNVSQSINTKNCKKSSNNTSGVNGVYWNRVVNKWEASMMVDYKKIVIGYFSNFEDAKEARNTSDIENGFYANHGKRFH